MTPTRAQYDAVLTRSSAGVRALSGDLDDDEDRNTALDWLENITRQARLVDRPDVCGLDRDEQTITVVFWADADPDRASALVREMLIATQPSPSVHESDERGSDGTHGPREPEIDAEPFELTKALKACHATPNPQPEFRTDPVLEALLDEEEAIARGDRTAHMSARVVASNDWPPPAKGTHESDLLERGDIDCQAPCIKHNKHHDCDGVGGVEEWDAANEWSCSR